MWKKNLTRTTSSTHPMTKQIYTEENIIPLKLLFFKNYWNILSNKD